MEWITSPEIWISLITLTILEIVLGIDNLVFITILADKLPEKERHNARQIGLGLALVMRIGLLLSLNWLIGLTDPILHIWQFEFSGRDLILLAGGLFLLGKSTFEIHDKLEGEHEASTTKVKATLTNVVLQIMLLDIVFSIDSVITAIGMANEVLVMIAAVVIAVIIMMFSMDAISSFISKHPTLKMLALSLLLLIGISLVAEGFHQEISKGYIYFAMGFSIFVEILNIRIRGQNEPVKLRPDIKTTDKAE